MKIGFISDIHEDIISLEKAFNALHRTNCEKIVCLGDIIGFTLTFFKNINGRNANECISLLKKHCDKVVVGNHDLYAIKKIPEFTAGFNYPPNWYSLDYNLRLKLSKNKIWFYEDSEIPSTLSDESIIYLKSLSEYLADECDSVNFLFSHFNYPDLSGSTVSFPKSHKHLIDHFNFMNENKCLISISGHGHIEGCIIANHKKIEFRPFGTYELTKEPQWIVGPCVANTTRKNGVMIFDTSSFQLEIIPLK